MSLELRTLHLRLAAGAQLRTASYDGRDHLVVPVIALMEGIIWPVNAEEPEFVPADVLAFATSGWDGEPVMMGHPMISGVPVSANSPSILEEFCFGRVFNTASSAEVTRTKKLSLEAWLDPIRAAKVGPAAERVIARVRAGESVEVSVGAFVALNKTPGEWNGKKYKASWSRIMSDHLAMLDEDERGACSVEMGCGTNRTATMHILTGHAPVLVAETPMKKLPLRSLKERVFDLFRGNAEMSDVDYRNAIDSALRATEPGYLGIVANYPDEKLVIFEIRPEEQYLMIRRDYNVAEDGTVTLGEKREEVEPVLRYETKAAAEGEVPPVDSAAPKAAGDCGCGGHKEPTQEEQNMDKATKIAALIALGTLFKPGDEALLNACSDTRIDELTAQANALKTSAAAGAAATTTTDVVAATGAKPSYKLEDLPEEVQTIVADHRAAQVAQKNGLVTELKAMQDGYSETDLNAMTVTQLTKLKAALSAVLPKVDFSGAAPVPRAATDAQNATTMEAPGSTASRLLALKK